MGLEKNVFNNKFVPTTIINIKQRNFHLHSEDLPRVIIHQPLNKKVSINRKSINFDKICKCIP